jgi:cellobiose-specific phosphotransferase system component IIC
MFLLLFGFIGFVCFSDVKYFFKVSVVIFSVILIIIFATFFWFLSSHVNLTLKALSQTIQSMIDDNPKNTFSELDDTMLSKLQSQVIKLSDILKSHTLRQKRKKKT